MKKLLLLAAVCACLSGCVTHEFNGGQMKSVSDVHFAQTHFKRGRSCANYFLGFPIGGEKRVLTAIKNGQIDTVEFAEETTESYIIYSRKCIDVYGQ